MMIVKGSKIGIFIIGLYLLPSILWAQDFKFSTDVPTTIGGPVFLANQTVYYSGGIYNLDFDGPSLGWTDEVNINALALTLDVSGDFVFSTDAPFFESSSGGYYEPRDVIYYNQAMGTFTPYLLGASVGLGPEVNIDALAFNSSGDLILSFDEPVFTGLMFQPYDLAVYSGGIFNMLFNGALNGMTSDMNICGTDINWRGDLLFCFDAPVNLGGVYFIPGEIVQYSGGVYTSYFLDAAFPAANAMVGFTYDFVSPGRIPNGDDVTGTVLTITKNTTSIGDIDLTWGASCLTTASDYSIHEGLIGSGYYSHTSILCSTSGALSWTITPAAADTYYLIVPLNYQFEGSYGIDSTSTQRPQSTTPCRINQYITPCP